MRRRLTFDRWIWFSWWGGTALVILLAIAASACSSDRTRGPTGDAGGGSWQYQLACEEWQATPNVCSDECDQAIGDWADGLIGSCGELPAASAAFQDCTGACSRVTDCHLTTGLDFDCACIDACWDLLPADQVPVYADYIRCYREALAPFCE